MRGNCIAGGAHRKLPQLLTLCSSPLSPLGCAGLRHLPQSHPSSSCSYKAIFSSSHLRPLSLSLCAKKLGVRPIAGCGCKAMGLELTQPLTSPIPSHPIPSEPPQPPAHPAAGNVPEAFTSGIQAWGIFGGVGIRRVCFYLFNFFSFLWNTVYFEKKEGARKPTCPESPWNTVPLEVPFCWG